MKKVLKTILINYFVFWVIIISIETLLQLGHAIYHGNLYFLEESSHQQLFEAHPYLVGRLKKNVHVFKNNKNVSSTELNTRYTGANLADTSLTRVGVFGGSTAFGTGTDDKDSWPALLQDTLGGQYAVINYGTPGYSTVENIIQLALLAPEDSLDYILIYCGWNDIRNYHDPELGPDYYSHGTQQYSNLGLNASNSLYASLEDVFISLKLIRKLSKNFIRHKTPESYENNDPIVDQLYKRNLQTIKTISSNLSADVIFVPQILNSVEFERNGDESSRWSTRIKNSAMPALIERFNHIPGMVCDSNTADCVVLNTVLEANWKDKHFVDEGHFSRAGGIVFSGLIARYIEASEREKRRALGREIN